MYSGILQAAFFYTVLISLLVLSFFVLQPFLVPLSLAAVFATILYPLYRAVLARELKSPNLAAFAVTLLGLLIILVPVAFVGSRIVGEAQNIYGALTEGRGLEQANTLITQFYQWSGKFTGNTTAPLDASAELASYAKTATSWVVQNIGNAFSGIASFGLELLIFFMALFFLLRDGEQFKREIIKLSPLKDADDELIFARLKQAVNSVVRGSLFVALIQGTLTGIGFTLFGVPNSVLWGACAMIAALIPGIGTSLILIPGILFLFIEGHTAPGIGLLIWGLLGVGLIDNFLGPKLMGSGMKLHSLPILLFVLGGVGIFGPAGIFLGPLCLSLLFAFLSIYAETRAQNGHGVGNSEG